MVAAVAPRRRLRVPITGAVACLVLTYLSFRTEACGALYTREGVDKVLLEEVERLGFLKLCVRRHNDRRSVDGVLSMSVIPGKRFMVVQSRGQVCKCESVSE